MRFPFVLLLAASACTVSASDASPPPGDTTHAATLGGKLLAPRGFTVSYFAEHLGDVRFMAVSPSGVLYASQPGKGRIIRLPDANHDGKADEVIVVADGL